MDLLFVGTFQFWIMMPIQIPSQYPIYRRQEVWFLLFKELVELRVTVDLFSWSAIGTHSCTRIALALATHTGFVPVASGSEVESFERAMDVGRFSLRKQIPELQQTSLEKICGQHIISIRSNSTVELNDHIHQRYAYPTVRSGYTTMLNQSCYLSFTSILFAVRDRAPPITPLSRLRYSLIPAQALTGLSLEGAKG